MTTAASFRFTTCNPPLRSVTDFEGRTADDKALHRIVNRCVTSAQSAISPQAGSEYAGPSGFPGCSSLSRPERTLSDDETEPEVGECQNRKSSGREVR